LEPQPVVGHAHKRRHRRLPHARVLVVLQLHAHRDVAIHQPGSVAGVVGRQLEGKDLITVVCSMDGEVGGGEGDDRGLEDDGGDGDQGARAEDDAHADQDVLPWPPWRACLFAAAALHGISL